jgi:hypothetical protein
VLERLVHTPKDLIPSNLALMKIRVSGEGQGRLGICRALTIANQRPDLLGDPLWFGLAVPSVVVPVWNVVLYPQASGFWEHVSLESVEPFELDPRLFPEGTPVEPRQ